MRSDPVTRLRLIFAALILGIFGALGIAAVAGTVITERESELLKAGDERDAALSDVMSTREMTLAPYRILNRALGRHYYPDSDFLIRDDGQILQGSEAPIDPEKYADALTSLRDLCKEEGKDFLYVLGPGKPQSDEELRQYGISCFRNENADGLMAALKEREVPYLDLRPVITEAGGGDMYALFDKTDHHWTADGGLIAARTIAGELNERFDTGLDTAALDEERLIRSVVEEPWVGEEGMKLLGSFGPKDRLVVWRPKEAGHFHLFCEREGIDDDGGFELFLREDKLRGSHTLKNDNLYYYFMGGNHHLVKADNLDLTEGSLLVVKDSFSCVVVPYLSLTSAHLTTWDMRVGDQIKAYIKDHPEIRTVIVMYTVAFSVKSDMNAFK